MDANDRNRIDGITKRISDIEKTRKGFEKKRDEAINNIKKCDDTISGLKKDVGNIMNGIPKPKKK